MTTNNDRAERAYQLVRLYCEQGITDEETAIRDILSDLMHLSDRREDADQMNVNFEAELAVARRNYEAELDEESDND